MRTVAGTVSHSNGVFERYGVMMHNYALHADANSLRSGCSRPLHGIGAGERAR